MDESQCYDATLGFIPCDQVKPRCAAYIPARLCVSKGGQGFDLDLIVACNNALSGSHGKGISFLSRFANSAILLALCCHLLETHILTSPETARSLRRWITQSNSHLCSRPQTLFTSRSSLHSPLTFTPSSGAPPTLDFRIASVISTP